MTTTTRRGYQLVDKRDGSPASQIVETREAPQRLLDELPDFSPWARDKFSIVECEPMPEGPSVPWARSVLVEQATGEGGAFTAEATLSVLDDKDLPSVGVEQHLELVAGEWIAADAPRIFVSGPEYVSLTDPADARALAGALSQVADRLAVILAGEQPMTATEVEQRAEAKASGQRDAGSARM